MRETSPRPPGNCKRESVGHSSTRTGRDRHVTGTYFCSDGKQGNFTTTSFLVTGTEMQIRMDIKLTGSESCTIDAILGGSRF